MKGFFNQSDQTPNWPLVALEMDRLKDIHCGLGQVCLHLGRALIQENLEGLSLSYLLYPGDQKWFSEGRGVNFQELHKIYRLFPWLAPRCELWHCLHQDARYLPSRRKTPMILTINDLNFLREGNLDQRRISRRIHSLQKLIDRSSFITCISEFTAREVRAHFNLNDKPLKVVYLGAHLPEFDTAPARANFCPPGKYFFSVGTILPKKNFHVVVPMLVHLPDYHWVCAGSTFGHYADEIKKMAENYGVGERVHFPGKITEEEKYHALYHAQALLHPSLAEGFGIPPLEAMNFGLPVFLSQECSLPEIGGEDAFYFKNFEPEYMAQVVSSGLSGEENSEQKRRARKLRAQSFSWEKCAREYIQIYRQVLGIKSIGQ